MPANRPASPAAMPRPAPTTSRSWKKPGWVLLLAGVLLPAVTLAVEMATHLCGSAAFDPVPTPLHAALIACVPLGNLLLWRALRRGGPVGESGPHRIVNGFVMGVSGFYALLFLPLTPVAAVMVIWFGLGLLPLGPLLSFLVAVVLWRRLRQSLPPARAPLGVLGALLSLGILGGAALPEAWTRAGVVRAASGDPAEASAGLRMLRRYANRDWLLRACYVRMGSATDMLTLFAGTLGSLPTPQQARAVYFRLTGDVFNSVPAPATGSRWNAREEFQWDPDQGGDVVAGRLRGLELPLSRIEGSVDGDAALAYLEWTLEFHNTGTLQREARAQVLLPPGAVVSRVTLWVDGEEREAAFAGRGAARQAYEQVVARRRDPLLVTTSGPDRVLVQCFPVLPGGAMKIRLGITAPLELANVDEARLWLPRFVERNFNLPADMRHLVDIRSRATLRSSSLAGEGGAVHGALSNAGLERAGGLVEVRRDQASPVSVAWITPGSERVEQSVAEMSRQREPVVIVLDGSLATCGNRDGIADALAALPEGSPVSVLLAHDGVVDLGSSPAMSVKEVAEAIRAAPCTGGQEATRALEQALARSPDAGAVLLWVHGPQPLEPDVSLAAQLQRKPAVKLVDLQVRNGPNQALRDAAPLLSVQVMRTTGSAGRDVARFFDGWRRDSVPVLERVHRTGEMPAGAAHETSQHLVKLWAHVQVLRELAANPLAKDAQELAVRHRLVTPVTGAVVLETVEETNAVSGEPAASQDVPSVPEPSFAVLAGIAVLLGAWALRRKPECG